jgi:hypothetical protein
MESNAAMKTVANKNNAECELGGGKSNTNQLKPRIA